MLSRTKPATGPGAAAAVKEKQSKKKIPKLEDFINQRDYMGAITLLEVSEEQELLDNSNEIIRKRMFLLRKCIYYSLNIQHSVR